MTKSAFWQAVGELAALRIHTPPERRAMSAVREFFAPPTPDQLARRTADREGSK